MKIQPINPEADLFFLPYWWIEAFLKPAFPKNEPFALKKDQATLGFVPQLDHKLLPLCFLMLSQIQDGEGKDHKISHWFYQFGHKRQAFLNQWRLLLGVLGALQLFTWDGDKSTAYGFFESWGWGIEEDGTDFFFKGNLTQEGRELLRGYTCAYGETQRFLKNQPIFSSVFLKKEPIPVEKSIWLDLKNYEPLLYLMLKAQSKMIQVHTYSLGMNEFLRTFEKISGQKKSLSDLMAFLKRIFYKIYAHGYLLPLESQGYFSFEQGLSFCYQVTPRSSYDTEKANYRNQSVRVLVTKMLENPESIVQKMGLSQDHLPSLRPILESIKRLEPQFLERAFFWCDTVFISHPLLLTEWFLRVRTKTIREDLLKFPLLASLKGILSIQDFCARLVILLEELREASDLYWHFLTTQKGMSYCQSFFWKEPFQEAAKNPPLENNLQNYQWADQSLLQIEKTQSREVLFQIEKNYLNTLAERELVLFLNLKKQLSKDLFYKQLRPRLIGFLAQNPHLIKELL
jgi:hypothetical protein